MTIDFSAVSDVSTALAALASLAAVYIAVKGLRATRNNPIADHLLLAYGEMITALQEISDQAYQLQQDDPSLQSSRTVLKAAFQRFEVAEFKVDLIEPPVNKQAEYGQWVRTVARNLAVDLLQADEWTVLRKEHRQDGLDDVRPSGLSDTEWADVSRSDSYLSVLIVGLDAPAPADRPDGVKDLEPWFRSRVKGYGDGTKYDDMHSVYSPHMPYMTQNCRLLDDFVREYLIPWARQSVRHAID